MLGRSIEHVQPDFAIRPLGFRVGRKVRCGLPPTCRARLRRRSRILEASSDGVQQELHHRQVHDAIFVQAEVHRAAPILGRGGGSDVVFAVGLLLHESDHKIGGGAEKGIDPFQELLVERVEVLPPEALHGPGRLADFVTPGRRRVRHHLARHRVGGVREEGARQAEFLPRVVPGHGQQVFDHFHIGKILVHVIAGKDSPEDLLGVVVHVVVAVPGGADLAARPVAEQAGRHLAFPQAAGQEILVVVPNLLQLLVLELDGGARPEILPALFRFLLELLHGDLRQARHLAAGQRPRYRRGRAG